MPGQGPASCLRLSVRMKITLCWGWDMSRCAWGAKTALTAPPSPQVGKGGFPSAGGPRANVGGGGRCLIPNCASVM